MLKGLLKKTDYKALFDNGAILLDVRNPNETKAGRIKGAKLVPLPELAQNIKAMNKPVVCVSGIRSVVAKSQLKGNGVEAYNGGAYHKMKKYFE